MSPILPKISPSLVWSQHLHWFLWLILSSRHSGLRFLSQGASLASSFTCSSGWHWTAGLWFAGLTPYYWTEASLWCCVKSILRWDKPKKEDEDGAAVCKPALFKVLSRFERLQPPLLAWLAEVTGVIAQHRDRQLRFLYYLWTSIPNIPEPTWRVGSPQVAKGP